MPKRSGKRDGSSGATSAAAGGPGHTVPADADESAGTSSKNARRTARAAAKRTSVDQQVADIRACVLEMARDNRERTREDTLVVELPALHLLRDLRESLWQVQQDFREALGGAPPYQHPEGKQLHVELAETFFLTAVSLLDGAGESSWVQNGKSPCSDIADYKGTASEIGRELRSLALWATEALTDTRKSDPAIVRFKSYSRDRQGVPQGTYFWSFRHRPTASTLALHEQLQSRAWGAIGVTPRVDRSPPSKAIRRLQAQTQSEL